MKTRYDLLKEAQELATRLREVQEAIEDSDPASKILSDIKSHLATSSAIDTNSKLAAIGEIEAATSLLHSQDGDGEDAVDRVMDAGAMIEKANAKEYENVYLNKIREFITAVRNRSSDLEDYDDDPLTEEQPIEEGSNFIPSDYLWSEYGEEKAAEIEDRIMEDLGTNGWDMFTSLETPDEVDQFIQPFL